MKKIFLPFCLAFLAVIPAGAQQTDTVYQKREIVIIDDEPVVTLGESQKVIVRNTRHRRNAPRNYLDVNFFSQIGLGYNGLVEDLGSLKLPEGAEWMDLKAKSINFNLMIVNGQFNITKHIGFRMGLELEVNNFRFENDVTLKLDQNGHIAPDRRFMEAGMHLEKTKLVNSYFNVPLVLRIGIGNRNQFEVFGGVVGGWRWNSYTKLKADNEMLDGKKRNRENYNLRNFHYGYTAGIAFCNYFGVYATYYPHSIFKSGDIDVRQANIGVLIRY